MTRGAPDPPIATILIATRDRRERVATAIRSALAQNGAPEVVVVDDGSQDGTYEAIQRDFPEVRLIRCERPVGCPASRNRGIAAANSPIVVCLDDDARLTSPGTVVHVTREFDDDRVAVVTIPYVNVRREQHVRQRAPDGGRWAAGTFAGGASALRRDAFLEVGGYADNGGHGEETDLAIRLLDRSWVIRLGRADHIAHDEELLDKTRDTYVLSSRNHLLGAWHNVPQPYLPGRLATLAVNALLVGVRGHHGGAALRGVGMAARACASGRAPRAPVSRATYRLSRRLARRGPMPLDRVEPLLHAVPEPHAT